MKKKDLFLSITLVLTLLAGTSFASDITGKFGVSGRIGFLVPADSDINGRKLGTDVGFVGGGGFIYGFYKNFAAELEMTHTEFDADSGSFNNGDAESNNFSLGVQYRFDPLPVKKLIVFLGSGLSILDNDFTFSDGERADVEMTAGIYGKGGFDYFLTRQFALTSEVKGVLAPEADIENFRGEKIGNFDPSSFAVTFGARFFFN